MNSLVIVVIMVAVLTTSMQVQAVNASHHPFAKKCTYPHTTLYVYTFPVQGQKQPVEPMGYYCL